MFLKKIKIIKHYKKHAFNNMKISFVFKYTLCLTINHWYLKNTLFLLLNVLLTAPNPGHSPAPCMSLIQPPDPLLQEWKCSRFMLF